VLILNDLSSLEIRAGLAQERKSGSDNCRVPISQHFLGLLIPQEVALVKGTIRATTQYCPTRIDYRGKAMGQIPDWLGNSVDVATSKGKVLAIAAPWRNVIRTGIRPWPAPELIQKVYKSRQDRAYTGAEHEIATANLGFYSDLQSLHSEDAITWSVFGPIVYAPPSIRCTFVRELLTLINVQGSASNTNVWLWRRIPHPDDLVPGGPEIDFGIQTDDVFLLGEAKWRSAIAAAQGVNRNKDQMALRQEFCEKYGHRLFAEVRHFVILGLSSKGGMVSPIDRPLLGASLHVRDTTWEAVVRIASHPCAEEVRQYLRWKTQHSKPE
jgi:hypothetical protein